MNTPVSARLVTLSACDTGRGQESASEGVIGLAWAFRAAGCPSVVASQWSVDDAATGRLIVSFYNHLYEGRAKDDALRLAMLEVIKDRDHLNPFYWAAFQVIGDTGPLFAGNAHSPPHGGGQSLPTKAAAGNGRRRL